MERTRIMDESAIRRALTRIAYEIIERNRGTQGLCLVGIRTRGDILARRIARRIGEIEKTDLHSYALDITPYRDDRRQIESAAEEAGEGSETRRLTPADVQGRRIVLVDDVLYTGRTVRAAIDALIHIGRPRSIALAVLIDRGHRELPIRPDFVGKNLPTAKSERIRVLVQEIDGTDEVSIEKHPEQPE